MRVKMSKPPPSAPTASAIGPCPTVIKFVGRPGTGRLPSTIAPPAHPRNLIEAIPCFLTVRNKNQRFVNNQVIFLFMLSLAIITHA